MNSYFETKTLTLLHYVFQKIFTCQWHSIMEHSSLTSDPSSQRDIKDIKPVFYHGDSKPTLQDIKDINTNAPQQDNKEIKY